MTCVSVAAEYWLQWGSETSDLLDELSDLRVDDSDDDEPVLLLPLPRTLSEPLP